MDLESTKKINNNYPKPKITKRLTINHILFPLFPNASTRRVGPLNFILQNINLTISKEKRERRHSQFISVDTVSGMVTCLMMIRLVLYDL
jgi:hypothetical protein